MDIPRQKLFGLTRHHAHRQPMKQQTYFCKAAFTLVETMVGLLCFVIIGGVIYLLLNSGMILYAKNMSVNTAHEDTRRAVNRLLRDIHAAVSVPQLIDGMNSDGTLQVHTSNTTPAPITSGKIPRRRSS